MFHSSTQKTYWTFANEDELKKLRFNTNAGYRKEFCRKKSTKKLSPNDDNFFITVEEHSLLVEYYERRMKGFCRVFNPPMPLNVMGTACQYLKRLYLRKSAMDYHPHIMSLVCLWLACKTEEFNVSMDQFQQNVLRNRMSKDVEVGGSILALELILIQELNFHLVVHNPFRPLEGYLIDFKTRFSSSINPDQLREHATKFIVRSLNTDVGLLFCPSQIALSALLSAASKLNVIIDRYVTDVLLQGQPGSLLKDTIQRVKKIRLMVQGAECGEERGGRLGDIEGKLEKCRNQSTDPSSPEYLQIQRSLEAERDERQAKKRKVEKERRERIEVDLLGF